MPHTWHTLRRALGGRGRDGLKELMEKIVPGQCLSAEKQ